jgi:hypothetical protein
MTMATVKEIAQALRALPPREPDPIWKEHTKDRLLRHMGSASAKRPAENHWAVFATYERDPVNFAQWVRAKGRHWRPVAVAPERLQSALSSIQPNIVVIDRGVPRRHQLEGLVRASSIAEMAIASEHELANIA